MGEAAWVRSHVERCLQDEWEECRVVRDGDGDYPFRHGSAACYVRVEETSPVLVRVFAHAVVDVRRTARLLAELNDLNASARSAHVYWAGGLVVVEHALHAAAVDRETLGHACVAVGTVAADIGTLLAGVFGGHTPFAASEETIGEEAG